MLIVGFVGFRMWRRELSSTRTSSTQTTSLSTRWRKQRTQNKMNESMSLCLVSEPVFPTVLWNVVGDIIIHLLQTNWQQHVHIMQAIHKHTDTDKTQTKHEK